MPTSNSPPPNDAPVPGPPLLVGISLRTVIDKCAAALAVLHIGGELQDANPAFCDLLGYDYASLRASSLRLESVLPAGEVERYRQHLVALSRGEEESYRQPQQLVRKDGVVLWADLTINLMRDSNGSPGGLVVTAVDITEQRRAEGAFREMSFLDPLTRLPNRRLLRDRLGIALARALRDERYVAVLFIDLDGFKPVNDSFGHDAGDQLLKAVAKRLLSCLRDYDTAARLGGDEFVVLLPDLAERDAARQVAERVRAALAMPFMTENRRLDLSASMGVALYPDHAETARDLLLASDEAMYAAKKCGGNCIVYSDRSVAQAGTPTSISDVTSGLVRLTWEAGFASGNAFIDAEHRELFRQSNRLLDLSTRTELRETDVRAALVELVHTVDGHFRHEERILAQVGYLALASHAARHHQLMARAQDLCHQPCDPATLLADILKFIVAEMIHDHVLTEDRDFFPCFTGTVAA